MKTKKFCTEQTVALVTDTSGASVDIGDATTGEVSIPTGSTITTLTYYHVDGAGNIYASQDTGGSAVTQTVAAAKSYPLPSVVMGGNKILIKANAAGNVVLDLKS